MAVRKKLTHIDAKGAARMVDVSGKSATDRRATARGKILLSKATLDLVREGKTPKAQVELSVALEPTTDIAAEIGRRKGSRLLVAFAAETDDVEEHARAKLASKGADVVVANRVGAAGTGFDSDTNDAIIVTGLGSEELPRLDKAALSVVIWDRIVQLRGKVAD